MQANIIQHTNGPYVDHCRASVAWGVGQMLAYLINEIGESRIRAAQRPPTRGRTPVIHKDDAGTCRVAWHRLPARCPGRNQRPYLRLQRL